MLHYEPEKIRYNKYLVLDLDETLIHTYMGLDNKFDAIFHEDPSLFSELYNTDQIYQIKFRKLDFFDDSNCWTLKRPHTDDFLLYCNDNFEKVIIWSAGDAGYVNEIVDFLYQNIERPYMVMTRDDIEAVLPKNKKNISKPLTRVFSKCHNSNLTNTLLIDNLTSNYEDCNRHNGITIPTFTPTIEDVKNGMFKEDGCLLDLKYWFDNGEFIYQKDVRYLDKKPIFPEGLEREVQISPKKNIRRSKNTSKINKKDE